MGIIVTVITFHLGAPVADANGIFDISSAAVERFFYFSV
jgi:hypothetical protein